MNRKKWLKLSVLSCLIVVGVSGCTKENDKVAESKEETTVTQSKEEVEDKVLSKLELIDEVIDNYYLNEDEIDQEKMIEGIYSGYVSGLEEAYTAYYTAEEYQALNESTKGIYSGIGVLVSQDIKTGVITVINPFENAPGYEAGIRKNDIIYKVSGEAVTGVDVSTVVSQIKGEEGTTVDMTIYRPSTDEYIDLTIERKKVETPTVEYEMKEGNIGYIQVTQFEEVTVEQFKAAVEDLKQQGMQGLIVDVRDNPGGLVTTVCEMLDYFLPKGTLVYTLDKDNNRSDYFSTNDEVLELPMVVLTNGNSASASEIFAAALQDYEWATVVGTNTFGKGIVQVILPLGDGSAVKVTTSEYFTPNGRKIHGIGVEPDVVCETDEENLDQDKQLDKAIEELEKKMK